MDRLATEIRSSDKFDSVAVNNLTNPQFGETLRQKIEQLPPTIRQKCDEMHTAHLTLATKLRDSNLVNGKILNRSQNSIREIINTLSGKRHNGLYGETGQPMPDANSGAAVAKP
mgnify:CR=1 FL=1|jgi:flagellar biosynthesis/type III secretory pathway chaperone